ncbi:hypothetical protein U1Q18_016585 [Sarracenia purpurea var. burkii]
MPMEVIGAVDPVGKVITARIGGLLEKVAEADAEGETASDITDVGIGRDGSSGTSGVDCEFAEVVATGAQWKRWLVGDNGVDLACDGGARRRYLRR